MPMLATDGAILFTMERYWGRKRRDASAARTSELLRAGPLALQRLEVAEIDHVFGTTRGPLRTFEPLDGHASDDGEAHPVINEAPE